ncbi:MAG: ribokinase [Bacteroidales bacterium]|nr:ribokinase [Bacteroidales bacterium]
MSRIVVVGSSNIDLTARMESLPRPGETIGGASILEAFGGKGANQAVSVGRLGGDVSFVTCVGGDSNGSRLIDSFRRDHIDTSGIKTADGVQTGMALIFLDSRAENCIAVAPGANNRLLPEDIDALEGLISDAEYLLIQLEIPEDTVLRSIEVARRHSVKVVLNPAPVRPLSDSLLSGLYLITPNETEAERLTGVGIESEEDAARAARFLLAKGVENVIITLGRRGAYVCSDEFCGTIPARKVEAVDTTAAGDVFNGALVTALSEGRSLVEAVRFASAASAISVTRIGAQSSVPYRNEIVQ